MKSSSILTFEWRDHDGIPINTPYERTLQAAARGSVQMRITRELSDGNKFGDFRIDDVAGRCHWRVEDLSGTYSPTEVLQMILATQPDSDGDIILPSVIPPHLNADDRDPLQFRVMDAVRELVKDPLVAPERDTPAALLREILATTNSSGGLVRFKDGEVAPAADPTWSTLGSILERAADVTGNRIAIRPADQEQEARYNS